MKTRFILPLILSAMCLTGCGEVLPESNDDKGFLISLSNTSVDLVLSSKSSFENEKDQLLVDNIPLLGEDTFLNLPGSDQLDNENTDYQLGLVEDGSLHYLRYFKYTFFVKNKGPVTADYSLKVKITENIKEDDGYSLDSVIRVMLFNNNASSSEHNYNVYAKKSDVAKQVDGQTTYQEYISLSPEQAQERGVEFPGYAEEFNNESTIANWQMTDVKQGDINRYTIVYWFEGEDPDSFVMAPLKAKVRLGIEINATEMH